MTTEYICGLPVDNLTEETICQDLPVYITSGRKMLVTSVNPQISLQVEQYPQVKAYIERATHRLPDGVGVVKMSKYLGGAICKRVTGIDVMDMMLQYADEQGHRIFLYGAKKEIVKKSRRKHRERLSQLSSGWLSPWLHQSRTGKSRRENQCCQPDFPVCGIRLTQARTFFRATSGQVKRQRFFGRRGNLRCAFRRSQPGTRTLYQIKFGMALPLRALRSLGTLETDSFVCD